MVEHLRSTTKALSKTEGAKDIVSSIELETAFHTWDRFTTTIARNPARHVFTTAIAGTYMFR
jgi:hypothetical protein